MQGYLLETGRQKTETERTPVVRGSVPPSTEGGWRYESADRHRHTYIYIYNLCMYVANTHGSRCRSNFKAAQAFGTAMAVHRLSLLCRATNRLSPYIRQMILEYLAVRVGILSPHVDDLLLRHVRQWGEFSFVLTGTIHPSIRKKKPLQEDMGADLDAVEPEAVERLEVQINCWSDYGGTILWSAPGRAGGNRRITEVLEDVHNLFDGRVRGPQAIVEEPHTAQEWQAFARRWIFAPPEPKQMSLRRWLRPWAASEVPGTAQRALARPQVVGPAAPRQTTLDRWLRPRAA